jgi:hypothetical protein
MNKKENWRNRIVGHGEQAAISFAANPLNWRIHPKAQRDALTGILEDVGWVQSVIVNKTTGFVIDGHARIEEALKLGDDTLVPFVEVELSEEEEQKILLTLDPVAAMAAADKTNLDSLMQSVSTDSEALQKMISDLADEHGLHAENESPYTHKVEAPIYEPKGPKPPLSALSDVDRYNQILMRIAESDVDDEIKRFLIAAASRHIVFNYAAIAEYYAHADSAVQRLFEDSALVIIDFDAAIEKGYVLLSKKMMEITGEMRDG